MGLISRVKTFVNEILEPADLNSELDVIQNVINGNLDSNNINASANIPIGAIANLSDEHNSDGTHSSINATTIATEAASGSAISIQTTVTGDSQSRFKRNINGSAHYGPGSGPTDLDVAYSSGDYLITLAASKKVDITRSLRVAENMTVVGTADTYIHAETTKKLSYGYASVTPDSSAITIFIDSSGFADRPTAVGGPGLGGISLEGLPDGSEIDALIIYGSRQAGGTIIAKIYKTSDTGASTQVGSTITINSGTGAVNGSDTAIGETVDTDANAYSIHLSLEATTATTEAIFIRAELAIKTTDLSMA